MVSNFRGKANSPWTDGTKEERLRELWPMGTPVPAIAMELGVSRNAVIGRAHRLGLPQHQNVRNANDNFWTEAKVERLRALWLQPMSRKAMARDIECSPEAINSKAKRLGLVRRTEATHKPRAKPQRPASAVMQAIKARKKKKPTLLAMSCGAKFGFGSEGIGERQKPLELPEDGAIPANATRCNLFDLDNASCRWPYNEPGAKDFFFCGAPGADIAEGRPYCKFHDKRSRRKAGLYGDISNRELAKLAA